MKFCNFFLLLWVIFALLDPDSESGSGFTDPIESGSNWDPDPQPCLKASGPALDAAARGGPIPGQTRITLRQAFQHLKCLMVVVVNKNTWRCTEH
jgi:hypothetical protein